MENNQTKKCTNPKCIKNKSLSDFAEKTKLGVITSIYGDQRGDSIKRNHPMPTYSKKILTEWLLNDWLFNLLYDNWKNCNFAKRLKPSIDRLNDDIGYEISNIHLITWGENEDKARFHHQTGILNYDLKPVFQLSLDGHIINEFISLHEADRQTGIGFRMISRVCKGERKTTGGFIWKFKDI